MRSDSIVRPLVTLLEASAAGKGRKVSRGHRLAHSGCSGSRKVAGIAGHACGRSAACRYVSSSAYQTRCASFCRRVKSCKTHRAVGRPCRGGVARWAGLTSQRVAETSGDISGITCARERSDFEGVAVGLARFALVFQCIEKGRQWTSFPVDGWHGRGLPTWSRTRLNCWERERTRNRLLRWLLKWLCGRGE